MTVSPQKVKAHVQSQGSCAPAVPEAAPSAVAVDVGVLSDPSGAACVSSSSAEGSSEAVSAELEQELRGLVEEVLQHGEEARV